MVKSRSSIVKSCVFLQYAVRNICRTLDTVGEHDIPIYRGAHEALVTPYENNCGYHGKDGFNDVVFDTEPDFSRVKVSSDL